MRRYLPDREETPRPLLAADGVLSKAKCINGEGRPKSTVNAGRVGTRPASGKEG